MDPQAKEELLLRLRSIEGHIRAIERMLEEDRACVDVVRQTVAVRRAMEKVSQLLVASHLRACIAAEPAGATAGDGARTVEDLLEVLQLTGRL